MKRIGIALILCLFSINAAAQDSAPSQWARLVNALKIVDQHHIDPANEHELVDGAIGGMLRALDPHSTFFSAKDYQEFRALTRGEYTGIGIAAELAKEKAIVVRVFPRSPAAEAGLKPGDSIVSVDGKMMENEGFGNMMDAIRGESGTVVELGIVRGESRAKRIKIRRRVIAVASVEATLLSDDIAIFQVHAFQDGTADEFLRLFYEIDQRIGKTPRGLVIDLRNNGGGFLHEAVAVADLFLSKGIILQIRGKQSKQIESSSVGPEYNMPIVLLCNGYTASAAEIVAAALQENGRAMIVGERTFGKGTIQDLFELKDGGAIKLTIAEYLTPKAHRIQARGIHPDVPLGRQEAPEAEALREENLSGHIREEESRQAIHERNALKVNPAKNWQTGDAQLEQALRLLRRQAN